MPWETKESFCILLMHYGPRICLVGFNGATSYFGVNSCWQWCLVHGLSCSLQQKIKTPQMCLIYHNCTDRYRIHSSKLVLIRFMPPVGCKLLCYKQKTVQMVKKALYRHYKMIEAKQMKAMIKEGLSTYQIIVPHMRDLSAVLIILTHLLKTTQVCDGCLSS